MMSENYDDTYVKKIEMFFVKLFPKPWTLMAFTWIGVSVFVAYVWPEDHKIGSWHAFYMMVFPLILGMLTKSEWK